MNSKPVVLRDQALQDFGQVVAFYRSDASPRIARSFAVAAQEAFRHISRFPGSGSQRIASAVPLDGLRSWPVKGFPFLIFYKEESLTIDVYRILHTARDIPASLDEFSED